MELGRRVLIKLWQLAAISSGIEMYRKHSSEKDVRLALGMGCDQYMSTSPSVSFPINTDSGLSLSSINQQ